LGGGQRIAIGREASKGELVVYQRILVAVDGSGTSDLAVREAAKLAKDLGATLRLVNVADEVVLDMYREFAPPDGFGATARRAGVKVLEAAQALARKGGVEAETRLVEITTFGRRVPDMIAEEAKAWPADVIVIGTHGRRGVSHLLLGSVAEGVMRGTSIPVLLIHGK